MADNLIFICGALRSGSSLTHLMLDHHPEIKNPGEFDFLFDQVADDGAFPDIYTYHDWLSTHRIFHSKSLLIDKSLTYPELIASFIQQLSVDGSVLALNVHRSFHRIPFLFPSAKYIHLIRDPRDVARSSIGMGWAGNVFYGVDHWIDTERDWKQLESKIDLDQFYQIRFEELILSPEAILNAVCDFIGVTHSEKMMAYADNSTYSKPDASLVNQWKRKLSVREIQYIESKSKDLMLGLGYELSGESIVRIGLVERVLLKVSCKFFRMKFSIKRYGFPLYFKECFSRLFNIKEMADQVILDKNKITKKHLK